MTLSSWLFGIIINFPYFMAINFEKSAESCEEFWSEEWMGKVNSVGWLLLTTVTPLMLMIVLYSRVVYRLWFRSDDGNTLSAQQMVSMSSLKYQHNERSVFFERHLALLSLRLTNGEKLKVYETAK